MNVIDEVVGILKNLKETSSTNGKKELLALYKTNKEVQEILHYALNPFKMFHFTSKNLLPHQGTRDSDWAQIKAVLDKLHNRGVTGNAALEYIHSALYGLRAEHQELFYKIIDKDLECGTGATLVNSVFPDLIPEFEVQLCNKWDDLEKLPFTHTFVSRKLDGVRVLAVESKGEFKFYSREGKEFTSLGKLKSALEDYFLTHNHYEDMVLDGELCITDKDGKEDFIAAVSQIKRKDYVIENPKFLIFDMYTVRDFIEQKGKTTFFERLLHLQEFMEPSEYWNVLKQQELVSPTELQRWSEMGSKEGWEGLILRNGVAPYEGKRTKNLLKVKKFYDHEFKIVGTQEGTGQFTGMLGALIVEGEYDKKKIRAEVGSGFKQSDGKEERKEFWAKRDQLVGKIVTVQFFELSQDKSTKAAKGDVWSLRFPTFKVLHGEKRTT